MNQILITRTTSRPLPPPEPLPEIVEPPRAAWLAGLANGCALGGTIGATSMYLFLLAIGRVA